MTELNNVSLFGAMARRLMVLFTVFGAMANQMTGLVKKTVLNFITMAGMIWRAQGITTTCAKDPKVRSSPYSRIIYIFFQFAARIPNPVLMTSVFGTCVYFFYKSFESLSIAGN